MESQAERIVASGVDAVTISMDSASSREHDSVRHHPGLFTKVEKGIRRLRDLRKKKKPTILLGVVITAKNFNTMETIINYWQDIVDEIIFQPVHNETTSSIFRVSDEGLLFSPSQKEEFTQCFEHIRHTYGYLKDGYGSELLRFFFAKEDLSRYYKCFAGTFMLQIDAYGTVYPCPECVTVLGNLKDEQFMSI